MPRKSVMTNQEALTIAIDCMQAVRARNAKGDDLMGIEEKRLLQAIVVMGRIKDTHAFDDPIQPEKKHPDEI